MMSFNWDVRLAIEHSIFPILSQPALVRLQKTHMRRKTCLILNLVIVCSISALLIRDRSINEVFEIAISPQNQSSIVIPGYLVSCLETDSLRCEMSIDRLPLVVEITSGKGCQATYGKQIVTCERIRASAADTVYIKGLQLSRKQQKAIETKIWVKSIASPRILADGVANGVLLQFVLFILSICSGINVYQSLYFYLRQPYLHQKKLLKVLVALIGGIGVFLFLLLYFFTLLMVFGYVG